MIRIPNIHLHLTLRFMLAGCLAIGTAVADEPGNIDNGVTSTDTDATTGISQNIVEKIGGEYEAFLGENTESVVTGLRTGNEITLTTTGSGGTATTTFTPPTGKMGYGNVSHAIGLGQEQLAQYGITEPTAEELQATLIGGDITTQSGGTANIDGVLTLRSEGMGWGEIAHEYGVKLGHVVSSVKAGKNNALASTSTQTDTTATTSGNQVKASGKPGKAYGKGIVTGAGGSSNSAKDVKVKANHAKSRANGRGIVTAAGGSVTGGAAAGAKIQGSLGNNGHAYGHGVVTAGGASVSSKGITSGKKGGGLAKGHSK